MQRKNILPHVLAAAALVLPVVALAHGAVDDGHVEESVVVATKSAGASALLKAFSPVWWGLLGASSLITAILSFGVWKFLHVPPITKREIGDKK